MKCSNLSVPEAGHPEPRGKCVQRGMIPAALVVIEREDALNVLNLIRVSFDSLLKRVGVIPL